MHTAFLLQEIIMAVEEWEKASVVFLDVKKVFDTMCQRVSYTSYPCSDSPDMYIWIILHNWYRGFTSAVLWNSSTSRSFKISQGVRQGAIVSPFLYSIE
jgi:hypothetical protein